MFDLDALRGARPASVPFVWAHMPSAFAGADQGRGLLSSVPCEGFTWSDGRGAKRYRMGNRTLVSQGAIVEGAADDLSPAWREQLGQIMSPEYREVLAGVAGLRAANCAVEARLCRYAAGCWMDPHTDRPDKIVTHVAYLNERWDLSWGGELRILNSPRLDDVAAVVPPLFGHAVVLVRSDVSWHAVAPVRAEVAMMRTSLLVHLVRV